MKDTVSNERIRRMSYALMAVIRKPAILMIGMPTVAQIRSGRVNKNWRASIFHHEQWWHLGGHILPDGSIVRWDGWAPAAGKWNALGFTPATQDLIGSAVTFCLEHLEIVPHFLKIEEDQDQYEEMMSWAQTQWCEIISTSEPLKPKDKPSGAGE